MSGERKYFTNLQEINSNTWNIKGVGDINLPVKGVGDVFFETEVDGKKSFGVFKEVLYVAKLRVNLVSIGKAAEKDGVKVIFFDNDVLFTKDKNVVIIGK